MDQIVCPYCEVKVRMSDVDDEGGVCPECGALITGSMLFNDEDKAVDDEDGGNGLDEDDDLDDDDDDAPAGRPGRRS